MQITKSNPEGVEVLTIEGQLDGTTSPQLETALLGPIQARASLFILDLDQVALISSAALRVLLSAAKRMKKHGGRILLCALRPEVKQVFDISDLTAFFAIHPDLAAALAAAKSAPAALATTAVAAPMPVAPLPSTPAPEPKAAAPEKIPMVSAPPPTAVAPAPPVPVAPPPPPPVPAATPTPAAPVSIPTPTPKPAAAVLPAIPDPPVPAQPLRRTSSAVLAKAVETRDSNPPAPAATAPASLAPSVERPSRRMLPVVVGAACVLLALIGLVAYLLLPKKPAPVAVVDATPAPTTAPPPAVSPASTRPVEPPSTPSPTPVVPTPTPRTPPPVVVVSTPRTPPPVVLTPIPRASPTVAAATPPSATPAAAQDSVTSASGAVNFNQANPENAATRQSVLRRIDAMPLAQKDKDRLYAVLDHARGLGKLITINFASGHTDLAPGDVEKLQAALRQPELQRFTSDPSVIIVVLGFADTHGNERTNKDVSERRARKVVDALQGPCGVSNIIHNLGMGGQAIAGESLEKNRVVEVWAVLP